MSEKFMNDLIELIGKVARNEAEKVLAEELPKILDTMTKPEKVLSDLVDYNTACKLLNVSKPTLHSYINTGKLTKHFLVPGGKPFLSVKEIERMMTKTRRVNPSLAIKNLIDPTIYGNSNAA